MNLVTWGHNLGGQCGTGKPGNIGKRILLITWELGYIGKRPALVT